jgi:hypothetical protein
MAGRLLVEDERVMAKRQSARSTGKVAAAAPRVRATQELRVGTVRAPGLEISRRRIAIEELTELIARQHITDVAGTKSGFRSRHRDIPDEHAKTKIKAYFEDRHGKIVYPSDVAEDLHLDYDQTVRLINELENDGQVARA